MHGSRRERERERETRLHATNWLKYLRNWHDNRITWLCTVVARDLDAHPLIPSSPPPLLSSTMFRSSLSLSLFLSSSSSIVRFCFCLFVPISVVLHYVPYKRQIRVIKRLGHAHCSLVVAHATSAFDLLPVLFVSSSVDSSIRCSSVQRDDFLLWWRSREMEIRERIQFLSEIKFFKVQDWNWADFCFRNRSGSFFFLIIRRENCKYLAVFAAFFNDSTLIEYREK